MKKLIIILSILSVSLTRCAAQNKIQEGEIKVKNDVFSVERSTIDYGKGLSYFIHSSKNKYEKIGIPAPKSGAFRILKSDFHVNEDQIKTIIYDVLGNKIKELHNRNEVFDVRFIFEINGDLTDTYYTLQENTIITSKEIDAIDSRLRTEIKASFTGKDYLNYKAAPYDYFKPIIF